MQNRTKMLKVKIKSLAEEARIIRLEERRSKPGSWEQSELHSHRVTDVRREQRLSLLAYAFLRGKPRNACERQSATEPDWSRVAKIVEKFGVLGYPERKEQATRLEAWKAAAVSVAA